MDASATTRNLFASMVWCLDTGHFIFTALLVDMYVTYHCIYLFMAEGRGVRIPAGARNLSLLQNVQAGSGAHPPSYSARIGVFSRGYSSRGMMLTTCPNLAPALKSGAILLLSLCAFMISTGVTSAFTL
jgi:hypothetical protein